MITAVLFDLDGVLCDSCDWHYEALNKALWDVAQYRISWDDHLITYNELPTNTKLDILVNKGIVDQSYLESIKDLKQKYTIDIINWQCLKDPIKIDLMEQLISRGYQIGCVTNCSELSCKLILERLGIRHLFNVVLTNNDFKNPKPSPECFNLGMKKLFVGPESTLIVEDSELGRQAASAAKAKTWFVDNSDDVTWKQIQSRLV